MNNYLAVLQHIHSNPQTFQSNHFRGNAGYYAEAASRGHITCVVNGKNSGKWHVTSFGLNFLDLMSSRNRVGV